MSILSDFEDRLARAVEGAFAGAFRSPVQPAELARALAHAMDDGRSAGVGKVYAPSVYTIELSGEDADKFGDAFEGVLAAELSTFLIDHARKRGYTLAGSPSIRFAVGRGLRLGRFRVGSEMASSSPPVPTPRPPAPGPAPAAPPVRPAARPFVPAPGTSLPTPAPVPAPGAPAAQGTSGRPEAAAVPVRPASIAIGDNGHEVVLRDPRTEIGRTAECPIQVEDANVSRHHAAIVAAGDGWAIEDLGSTNGTWIRGEKVESAPLADGDVITVGATRLVFRSGRG